MLPHPVFENVKMHVLFFHVLFFLHHPEAVYNIEVHGEHVYRVSTLSLLVHNASEVVVPKEVAGLGRVVGRGDAINPGTLADDLAATFSGGRYSEVILDADTVLYRAGTAVRPLGQFFDTAIPDGILQARIDMAVLPRWPGGGTSPIDSVIGVRIPKGTRVFVGEVSTQGGIYVGGTRQFVVVKPWTISGVKVVSVNPLL